MSCILFYSNRKNQRLDRSGAPGSLSDFSTSIVAKHQKIEVGPFEEMFFFKKSHNAEKTERGDALVSPGNVCYAEKRKNLFGSVKEKH